MATKVQSLRTDAVEKVFTRKRGIIHGAEGRPLLWDLAVPKGNGPYPTVIFLHGNKGFKDWGPWDLMADAMAEAGQAVLKFNTGHNGTTPDNPTSFTDLEAFSRNRLTYELEDLSLVIDWVNSRGEDYGLDGTRLGLLGHSRGGSLVLCAATQDSRVQCVVSWAAPADLRLLFRGIDKQQWQKDGVAHVLNARTQQQMPIKYEVWEDLERHVEVLDPLKALAQLTAPVLLVHGTADESVPISQLEELAATTRPPVLRIEGGNHTLGGTHPWALPTLPLELKQATEATAAFFKKHM